MIKGRSIINLGLILLFTAVMITVAVFALKKPMEMEIGGITFNPSMYLQIEMSEDGGENYGIIFNNKNRALISQNIQIRGNNLLLNTTLGELGATLKFKVTNLTNDLCLYAKIPYEKMNGVQTVLNNIETNPLLTNEIGQMQVSLTGNSTDVVIIAIEIAECYEITYQTNGGNALSSQYAVPNTAITLPTPTKTSYSFDGWYSNSELTTLIGQAGASYNITSSQTLYAKWTLLIYSIAFDSSSNTTKSNTDTTILGNTAYNTNLNSAIGYYLPNSITVTAGATTLTSGTDYTYTKTTTTNCFTSNSVTYCQQGSLTINASAVTGNITIDVDSVPYDYLVGNGNSSTPGYIRLNCYPTSIVRANFAWSCAVNNFTYGDYFFKTYSPANLSAGLPAFTPRFIGPNTLRLHSASTFKDISVNILTNTKYYYDYNKTSSLTTFSTSTDGINYTQLSSFATSGSAGTSEFTLFIADDTGNITTGLKMHYFKLYIDNNLTRDLIPAVAYNNTRSQWEPCFYDKLYGVYYFNANSTYVPFIIA